MKNRFFLFISFSILLLSCSKPSLDSPEGLLCELMRYPEEAVITDPVPEFCWIFPPTGVSQTAYRILVATSPDSLIEDIADMWDSKRVNSNKSISISYKGKQLNSNSSYYWKVKVWDIHNRESSYSGIQRFNTSDFNDTVRAWPGESKFIRMNEDKWLSENRQTATFHYKEPVELIKMTGNKWCGDFEKAAFGTLVIKLKTLMDGDSAVVYLGERRNKDFTVNKNPGRSNIGFYRSKLILKKGIKNYQINIPAHHSGSPNTQKLAPFYPEVLPFRYVEIILSEGTEFIEMQQKALFYSFNDNASFFYSSNKNINRVWELCKYTLKATPFLGLYADGNRERMPYEADAYIQQLGHYNVDREYSVARYTANFLLFNPSWPTEWNMQTIFMAWQDYLYTGDDEFLRKYYLEIKNKTLIELAHDNGLISTTTGKINTAFLKSINFKGNTIRDIVDWPRGTPIGEVQAGNAGPTPEGERDGYVFRDFNTVVNAFHYRTLIIMAGIAEILDKEEDKLFFISRSEKVKNAVHQNLFNYDKGLFVDGIGTDHSSLHANMFPLAFGLVPENYIDNVIDFLKSKGMACSVYGSQYLLEALFGAGETEYALSLIASEDKRSWINMLRSGSTMTTEAWDEYYKPNLTWNHAWGSAPANIIPRKLAGIEPIEPGFRKIKILPQPGNLEKIKLKLPTIRGAVSFELYRNVKSWFILVSVPGNSTAELFLPAKFKKIRVNQINQNFVRSEYSAGEMRNVFYIPGGRHSILALEN